MISRLTTYRFCHGRILPTTSFSLPSRLAFTPLDKVCSE
jgi:hypothetical protein